MSSKIFYSGSNDVNIRSDCKISIENVKSGGNRIFIKSKVESLYGDSIRKLIQDGLKFFNISNCIINVDDRGALPFVIMARFESAIRKMIPDEKRCFLPPVSIKINNTSREKPRRSRLYLPGNQPKLFLNAGLHNPDGIILDLEDSVSPLSKEDARLIVRNALRSVDFMDAERMVRINQLPLGFKDLEMIIPQKVNVILIPKVETGDQIRIIDKKIDELIENIPEKSSIYLMPIIESALGVMNAFDISSASTRIAALAIGLEDYTADIGTVRSEHGTESFFARSMIVNAAKASGIQAIDSVFSDVSDIDGLKKSVLESKLMGFDGIGCIHPRQIDVVHNAFLPSSDEIDRAKRVVSAFEKAEKEGIGVVALGNKMIDPPVVKRALRTVDMAISAGLLKIEWRNENGE